LHAARQAAWHPGEVIDVVLLKSLAGLSLQRGIERIGKTGAA
jgi:hypothetical protein